MSSTLQVESRIKEAFESLSPQLQLAAQYIIQFPDEVALSSMRALAAKVGVSPVTMLRLAQRLDFPDYNSLRDQFRERIRGQTTGGPFAERARQLQSQRQSGGAVSQISEAFDLDLGNLRATLDGLDPAEVETCIVAIERAHRVFVVGRRSCYPVAYGFFYAYQMFRRNGHLVEDRGGNFGSDFADIGSADVLIAISFEPYSQETVSATLHAAQRGATVVSITDSKISPLALSATHALVVANASPTFFQSITAAMTLAQALIALLLARGGEQAVQALDANEAHLGQFGAYWKTKANQGASL